MVGSGHGARQQGAYLRHAPRTIRGMTPADPVSRTDLNALALPDLYRQLSGTGLVRRLLELARDEDLGPSPSPWRGRARADPHPDPHGGADHQWASGDLTTAACVEPNQMG